MDPFGVFIEVYNLFTSPKPPYKVGKSNLEHSRALMTLSRSFWKRLGPSGAVWRARGPSGGFRARARARLRASGARAPSRVFASFPGRSRFFWNLREVPRCFSARSVRSVSASRACYTSARVWLALRARPCRARPSAVRVRLSACRPCARARPCHDRAARANLLHIGVS